jgi:hypothetical protein
LEIRFRIKEDSLGRGGGRTVGASFSKGAQPSQTGARYFALRGNTNQPMTSLRKPCRNLAQPRSIP